MKLTGIGYWYLENSFYLLIFSIEIENLCLPTTNVKLDFHSSIMFDRHTLFVLIFALSRKKIHLRTKISTEFTLKKAMCEI